MDCCRPYDQKGQGSGVQKGRKVRISGPCLTYSLQSGVRTLPQVFVDDVYRGSYDDINALEENGQLDDVLHMKVRIAR